MMDFVLKMIGFVFKNDDFNANIKEEAVPGAVFYCFFSLFTTVFGD